MHSSDMGMLNQSKAGLGAIKAPESSATRFRPEWWLPLLYLAVSAAWIYGSDRLVASLATTIERQRVLSTWKGLGFILSTTVLIHVGIRLGLRRERVAARWVREAQRFSQQIVQCAEEGIIVCGTDLRILVWNPWMERLTGRTAEEVIGQSARDVFPFLIEVGVISRIEHAIQGRTEGPLEFEVPDLNGNGPRWVQDTTSPLRDTDSMITGTISVVRDITDRTRAQLALSEREQEFRQLAEAMPQIVWACDAAGLNTYFNRHWVDYTGLSLEESLGHGWNKPFHPDDQQRALEAWNRAVRGQEAYSLQCRIQRHDGVYRWWLIRAMPLHDASGQVLKWFGTCTDIHEILETKEALRSSQERFHKAFHSAPMLMALSSVNEGRFVEVNAEFSRITGFSREEVLGRTSVELGYVAPEDRDALLQAIRRDGRVRNYELKTRAKSGREVLWLMSGEILEIHGQPVLLSMASDITEQQHLAEHRQSLEAQLAHLQRVETIGKLASGVAHDLNNVLAAILGVASVLKMRHPADPLIAKDAELLLRAGGRGKSLVASIRDFSRKELGSFQELHLNDLVRTEADLLEHATLKKVHIETHLDESGPRVLGDASSISNALMNLCVNACDAMQHGGTLSLSTRLLESGFVELVVEDNGEGMSAELLARAAEPFFTTKAAGHGTGLGLSQVFATARAHGGTVELRSEQGRGTRASLLLPQLGPQPRPPLEPTDAVTEKQGRALHILVIDDDELALQAATAVLEQFGHRADSFRSASEALKHAETNPSLDAVLLDFNMPGLDGEATLRRLRSILPNLPVIMATGHHDQKIYAQLKQFSATTLLLKPYGINELRAALASV